MCHRNSCRAFVPRAECFWKSNRNNACIKMKRLVAGPQISLHDLILAKSSYSKKSNRNNNACNQMKRFVAGSQISLHDHIRLHFLNPKRLLSVALLTCATTLSSLPEISGVVHQWSRHIVVFFAVMGGGVEAFRQDREAVDHQRQLSHVHSGPFFFLKNTAKVSCLFFRDHMSVLWLFVYFNPHKSCV